MKVNEVFSSNSGKWVINKIMNKFLVDGFNMINICNSWNSSAGEDMTYK